MRSSQNKCCTSLDNPLKQKKVALSSAAPSLPARRSETRNPAALPHLPFPGLLRDGPPTARLRKLRPRFFCHRQREAAIPLKCHLLWLLSSGQAEESSAVPPVILRSIATKDLAPGALPSSRKWRKQPARSSLVRAASVFSPLSRPLSASPALLPPAPGRPPCPPGSWACPP